MANWYALRVSYGRVLKMAAMFDEAGIECFVPMCRKKIEKDGQKMTVVAPAVSNLCFVHVERSVLDEFLMSLGEDRPVHYIWDKATRQPIIVKDKPMQDFIQVSRVMSDEVLYLKDISDKLRQGQKVRVVDGPFKGVEGVVVRVKRSRRVMVELPGMLAIATAYIDPHGLELL